MGCAPAFCQYLCKYHSEISVLDLSKKLSLPINAVEQAFKYWESQGVMIKKNKSYELCDLKKIEVNKLYNPSRTSYGITFNDIVLNYEDYEKGESKKVITSIDIRI